MKSAYLKTNPNSRGVREDYLTEKEVEKAREHLKTEDWIKDDPTTTDIYEVVVNGQRFSLEYEEMVELLAAMKTCAVGNESFIEAKLKADRMWDNIPVTSY